MITIKSSNLNSSNFEKKIKERLNANYQLEVGFFESAKYSNGVSVAQVAYWNEYGHITGNRLTPPRSFFRNTIKEKQKEWMDLYRDTYKQTKDMLKTLNILGTVAKNDISDSITNLSSPPNSNITINGGWIRLSNGKSFYVKGKKSSNPLVNSGLMRDAPTYEITKKGTK